MSDQPTDVVLVDEAQIFADALRARLGKEFRLHEYLSVDQLAASLPRLGRENEPREVVVLVDLNLGINQPSGLEALRFVSGVEWAVPVIFATDLDGDRAMFALAAAELTGGLPVVEKGRRDYAEQVAWIADRVLEGFRPTPAACTRRQIRWLQPLEFVNCAGRAKPLTVMELLFRQSWRLAFYRAALAGASQQEALRLAHLNPDGSPAQEIVHVLEAVRRRGVPWTQLPPHLNVAAAHATADRAVEHDPPLPWPRLNQFLAEQRAFFTDPALPDVMKALGWPQTLPN